MKIIYPQPIGLDFGRIGSRITHPSITDTTSVESVDDGFLPKKLRWTTSNPVLRRICLPFGISNRHMDTATTLKVHADGSPKLLGKRMNSSEN